MPRVSVQKRHVQARLTSLFLCGAGWAVMIGMLLLSGPFVGALAPFGPGMYAIDFVRLQVFGDFRALFETAALCSFEPGNWNPADLLEIGLMWVCMVLAMVLPSALRDPLLVQTWKRQSAAGRVGFVLAALCLSGLGACVQIALQSLGLLSDHLRLEHGLPVAVFLILTAVLYGTRHRWEPAPEDDPQRLGVASGFIWGTKRLMRCAPMLLLMFPLGLMNIVAMAAMLALSLLKKPLVTLFVLAPAVACKETMWPGRIGPGVLK